VTTSILTPTLIGKGGRGGVELQSTASNVPCERLNFVHITETLQRSGLKSVVRDSSERDAIVSEVDRARKRSGETEAVRVSYKQEPA
jgi:hypothetical protein